MEIGREDLSNIIRFIRENPQGIFVLPEGAIDLKREGIEEVVQEIASLTENERLSVILGVIGDPHSKAYMFAYGERERIYHIDQQFNLPCCSKKVKTAVRVCAGIKEPYMFTKFDLLTHPSSMDLNTLLGLEDHYMNYRGVLDRLGIGNSIIASASFFVPRIIDTSGMPVGNKERIVASDGHIIHYVSYAI